MVDASSSTSATAAPTPASLVSLFPLTHPLPNPISHPDLVPLHELALEVDLARSAGGNLSRWLHHIANVQASVLQAEKEARGSADEQTVELLGNKLSTAAGRKGLQRLTDLYERALVQFPTSYKLWKQYLDTRNHYILGTAKRRLNLKTPRKKRAGASEDDPVGVETILKYLNEGVEDPASGEVGENLEDNERDVDAGYQGWLDGVIGAEEWRSLAGAYERALRWLPNVGHNDIMIER